MRLISGAVLVTLAVASAYDLLSAFGDASRSPELPGLQIVLAVAMAVAGLALLRQSLLRVPRPAVGTHTLAMFGYGWLIGVLVNDVVTLLRRSAPRYDSPLALALDVVSWLVVTLILAIPGLLSIFIARRL